MTISDKWILDRARELKAGRTNTSGPRARKQVPPIDHLWAQLQRETERQAAVFTKALGDPKAVVVDTPPDEIAVRASDGRQITVRVDREHRKLFQSYRDRAGAVRTRSSIITFITTADGEATFNFGGVQAAAGSILRRIIG